MKYIGEGLSIGIVCVLIFVGGFIFGKVTTTEETTETEESTVASTEPVISFLGAITFGKVTTDEDGTKSGEVMVNDKILVGLRSDGMMVWSRVQQEPVAEPPGVLPAVSGVDDGE